jgi:uncharacterized protein (DUF1786 family)
MGCSGYPDYRMSLLAIDVGRGTQDILIYDPDQSLENSVKLVLPSPTRIIAERISRATRDGRGIFLSGATMGGGPSVNALSRHMRANLPIYATEEAAKTIHDNLSRVRAMGIQIVDTPPEDAVLIRTTDYMEEEIRHALALFSVPYPEHVAVAVQDHGYSPDRSNRIYRFELMRQSLESGNWNLFSLIHDPPLPEMTRMQAVREQAPDSLVIDTGAAAVIGALSDPVVRMQAEGGATLINAGNGHTLVFTIKGEEIYGIFEHHTAALDHEHLNRLLLKLQDGTLTNEEIFDEGGHGAALRAPLASRFTAITGPNRRRLMPDAYQAAPYGDMMLTGCFGLLTAWERLRGSGGAGTS